MCALPCCRQNRITGYVFTQQISVKISNLTSDTLGAVVDTAVKAGANNLQACRGSGTLLCCMYVSWPGARAGHSWQLQVRRAWCSEWALPLSCGPCRSPASRSNSAPPCAARPWTRRGCWQWRTPPTPPRSWQMCAALSLSLWPSACGGMQCVGVCLRKLLAQRVLLAAVQHLAFAVTGLPASLPWCLSAGGQGDPGARQVAGR